MNIDPMIEHQMLGLFFRAGAVGLILIGFYGMVMHRNLIRMLLGLGLVEAGAHLFLISVGFRRDAVAPIIVDGVGGSMVDPVPQAMILTAIVIGVAVLALGLALVVRVHRAYGVLEMDQLKAGLEEEHAAATGPESLPASMEERP